MGAAPTSRTAVGLCTSGGWPIFFLTGGKTPIYSPSQISRRNALQPGESPKATQARRLIPEHRRR